MRPQQEVGEVSLSLVPIHLSTVSNSRIICMRSEMGDSCSLLVFISGLHQHMHIHGGEDREANRQIDRESLTDVSQKEN